MISQPRQRPILPCSAHQNVKNVTNKTKYI